MLVPPDGSIEAHIMLIGEAPGRTEVITQKPFTGRSGKLLRQVLYDAASLSTDLNNLYITNVVKFNPPNNRNPLASEIKEALPALIDEVEQVKPKLIVLCGAVAHKTILNSKFENEMIADFKGYKTYSIYHPAYILRNATKRAAYHESVGRIVTIID